MKLKTYHAFSVADALAQIRKDLGDRAVIIHTRTFRRGGFFGFGGKTVYEVTASDSPGAKNPVMRSVHQATESRAAQRSKRASTKSGPVRIDALTGLTRAQSGDQSDDHDVRKVILDAARERSARAAQSRQRVQNPPAASASSNALLASLVEAAGKRSQQDKADGALPKVTPRTGAPAAGTKSPARANRVSVDAGQKPDTGTPSNNESARSRNDDAVVLARARRDATTPLPENRPSIAKSPDKTTARRYVIDPQSGRVVPAQAQAARWSDRSLPPSAQTGQPSRSDSNTTKNAATSEPKSSPTAGSNTNVALPQSAPPSASSASAVDREMREEIAALRELVGQVLENQANPKTKTSGQQAKGPRMPAVLYRQYLALIENEVAEDLAQEVCRRVRTDLTSPELRQVNRVRDHVAYCLSEHIPFADDQSFATKPEDGRPLTIALVGPTGVGKTTTVAKMAATCKLQENLRVAMITTDTYRIAAVDQLRTYAEIIGIPLDVVLAPEDMRKACESVKDDVDVLLIDTAGRSPNDAQKILEINAFIREAAPHETHLVLASTSDEKVLMRTIERFSEVPTNRVIFTKVDEAVHFGTIVNVMKKVGKRLSFITTGQEVPDHIERGEPSRIARLVLGEKSSR